MRIAEKTVELNFCKGLPALLGESIFWFGLTQAQEARAGFDACTKLGGQLLLFQVKASRVVLKSAARQFQAPHDQMQALRDRASKPNRRVFYVFPSAGTTAEVCGHDCFSHCSQFLDVLKLPVVVPKPLAAGKLTVRASGVHYIDVQPGTATIHSEPFEVPLVSSEAFAAYLVQDRSDVRGGINAAPGDNKVGETFDATWRALSRVSRAGMYGAVVA